MLETTGRWGGLWARVLPPTLSPTHIWGQDREKRGSLHTCSITLGCASLRDLHANAPPHQEARSLSAPTGKSSQEPKGRGHHCRSGGLWSTAGCGPVWLAAVVTTAGGHPRGSYPYTPLLCGTLKNKSGRGSEKGNLHAQASTNKGGKCPVTHKVLEANGRRV